MLEIGVGGASILGGSILGINNGCVGVEGGVNSNFIIETILLIFLVFYGVGGVGGRFAIYQLLWGIEVIGDSILGGNV